MKVYNITKKQLLTIWFFGFVIWIVVLSVNTATSTIISEFTGLIIFFLPFLFIFYTLGWLFDSEERAVKTKITFRKLVLSLISLFFLFVSMAWIVDLTSYGGDDGWFAVMMVIILVSLV